MNDGIQVKVTNIRSHRHGDSVTAGHTSRRSWTTKKEPRREHRGSLKSSEGLVVYRSEMFTARTTPSPMSICSWYVPGPSAEVSRLKMYWPSAKRNRFPVVAAEVDST